MKLLPVLILVELAFLVWSLATKRIHAKEKTVARGGVLLLFIILLLTGVLEWGARYYTISFVLVVQLILGAIAWRRGKEKPYRAKRRVLCLLLVEVMVFALNCWNGAYVSGPAVAVAVAVAVLVIFLTVNLILWLNDSRSAREFNRELAEFRQREGKF